MFAKARLKPAVSATIRRSQAKARLAPAPAATPFTAAITGLAIAGQRGDDRVVVLVDRSGTARRSSRSARSSTCSLRSWPVQNARPVPVSTTQRAAGSSATWRIVSSSSTLVATSRLFIASGPVERDGGDAVGQVEEHRAEAGSRSWVQSAGSGSPRAADRPGQRARQRATNRSAPGLSRVASLANSSAPPARPVGRAAARSGSPGSANRNLRHSWTRWNRAANAASSLVVAASRSDQASAVAATRRTPSAAPQVPARSAGVEPSARPCGRPPRSRTEATAGKGADPDVGELGEPGQARSAGPGPARARRAARRTPGASSVPRAGARR